MVPVHAHLDKHTHTCMCAILPVDEMFDDVVVVQVENRRRKVSMDLSSLTCNLDNFVSNQKHNPCLLLKKEYNCR